MGEFFREAAVLIGVFGLLEPLLKEGGISFEAIVVTIGLAMGLFLLALWLTFLSEAHR